MQKPIDQAEIRRDGPYAAIEGKWCRMLAHECYMRLGFVTFDPDDGGILYDMTREVTLEEALTQEPGWQACPGTYMALTDARAVEIVRQYHQMNLTGIKPTLGPIDLSKPIKLEGVPDTGPIILEDGSIMEVGKHYGFTK